VEAKADLDIMTVDGYPRASEWRASSTRSFLGQTVVLIRSYNMFGGRRKAAIRGPNPNPWGHPAMIQTAEHAGARPASDDSALWNAEEETRTACGRHDFKV
jgi:hypothetical protein